MRIVHVIDSLAPQNGGPPAVAVQLSAAQAAEGHDVMLIARSDDTASDDNASVPNAFAWVPGVERVSVKLLGREAGVNRVLVPRARALLTDLIRGAGVVHVHGFWEPMLFAACGVASEHRVPYVVRPAGMLDPWSLTQKHMKKKAALLLGWKRALNEASFVHALNRDERDLIALLGVRCPIEVVPNGVYLESVASAPSAGAFRKLYPELGDSPIVLFLSRLHFKKGLDYLAHAFAWLAKRDPEVKLVVAGPDEGKREKFQERIRALGLTDRVLLTGALYGEEKYAALRDATVFCLPSRQEGFSVAILEALSMGVPAVVSHACHFPEVEESGSGNVVSLNPDVIGGALLRIISDPCLREKMSGRASKLVSENYTWSRISGQCTELYRKRRKASESVREHRVKVLPEGGPLKILHVVWTLDPSAGGVPVVAIKLAVTQALAGHDVHMLVYRTPSATAQISELLGSIAGASKVTVHYIPEPVGLECYTAGNAARACRHLVADCDVAHLHGVWDPILLRVAAEARAVGTPYVVMPHGMLDPWSLSQKPLKKKLAMALLFRRMLNGAMFLHALNRDERDLLAPLGLRIPVELIPNGVFAEDVLDLPPTGTFRAAHPALGDDPYVLFLSRLHFKKGLDYLADAFKRISGNFPRLRLVVAGPDGGARHEFERGIAAVGLTDRVHLVGPLYGSVKAAAMVDAAVFCLPSRQEGFSVAITEALGIGCPCVVTKACHYPEVEEAGAGYCVELDGASVADGLTRVLRDPDARGRMGTLGRALVLGRFTWPVIGKVVVDAYHRHGGKPSGAQFAMDHSVRSVLL